jgi:hypothetical protein
MTPPRMQHLSDLLAAIPLPETDARPVARWGGGERFERCVRDLMVDLGADLPAGHLHEWGGAPGAGTSAFLLSMLLGAARRGRRVVYATYDLPPDTLALRLLAMAAGVRSARIPEDAEAARALEAGEVEALHGARVGLAPLPFAFLPARGLGVASLHDRLVRAPFRPEVLAVDSLQGVVRAPGTDLGAALKGLSDLAGSLHVAVICAVRAPGVPARGEGPLATVEGRGIADRLGWISACAPGGARRAEVLENRHGLRPALSLRLVEGSGALESAPE